MEAQQLIELMKEPFLSAMNDAMGIDPRPRAVPHLLWISLLESLPCSGPAASRPPSSSSWWARSRQRRLNNPSRSSAARFVQLPEARAASPDRGDDDTSSGDGD